ncbi:MAG: DMT family transporter, partial [Desulfohalobiaceae bacterium]|nr:DMT family transporter [Desulfohalobiaceae bacterium]
MTSPISRKKALGAELILLSVAFIWGTTFTIVKEALSDVQVFVFLGQRFLLAFVLFLPFMWLSRKNVSKQAIVQSLLLSLFLFGAYGFQTMGLKYTSASNAAFVTG